MRIDLNHNFEFPDDDNWGKKFWNGIAIIVVLAAGISIVLIRLGAFIAEWYYE